MMHVELYYSNGGHGGPYGSPNWSLILGKAIALLRGDSNMAEVEIRPVTSPVRGGYGRRHEGSIYINRDELQTLQELDKFNNPTPKGIVAGMPKVFDRAVTKQVIDLTPDQIQASFYASMRAAFEFGYRACEKGHNLETALSIFDKQMT